MKHSQNRHKLIAAVLLTMALLIAAATGAWYLYMQQKTTPTATIESQVAEDSTPSLGACELITTADIRASFKGGSIQKINEGVRTGSTASNEETSENCVFAFSTAKSTNNTLSVSVYPYTSTPENETSPERGDAKWSEISASNPMAYFGRGKADNDKTTLYKVRSVPGNYNVLLTLSQPSDAIVFDEPDSLNFLVGIVTKVKYEVLTRSAEKATEAINGGGPDAPPSNTIKETGTVK